MPKALAVTALAMLLAACANPALQRAEAEAHPQDVAYCQYERSKVQVGDYAARSALMQGYEAALIKNQVYADCLAYRATRRGRY
jgi:hypothetical protein